MAASAYASVVSLWNTLHQLQSHPLFLDNQQIPSICRKVSFLEDFLERYSHGGSRESLEDLQRRIYLAADQAEDLINHHMAIQMREDDSKRNLFFCLQKVTEKMDDIIEKVKEIWDLQDVKVQPLNKSSEKPVSVSASAHPAGETTMVGFEDQRIQLIDMLTGEQTSSLQVISITGMGGAGKTTLARSVYSEFCMEYHFDIRIWVTISQDYTLRDVLLQFREELAKFQKQKEQFKHSEGLLTDVHLGEEVLRKSLWNRRYLIVIDDIWSTDVWNDMRSFFPDNGNHSRILVTTRLTNVGQHLGSTTLKLPFLEEDESWKLFCDTAFKGGYCPNKLKDIGKKIVKKCKGLPLSINVVGGLLRKSRRTVEHWESVANYEISSIMNSGDEDHFLRILSLSYSHLPTHLKPCFLYMGIFREDYEIHTSKLINLWIAQGFLKPNEDQSLEETAEEYLNDLVDRNLILVGRRGSRGKISTCYIHDVLRDLCLKVAEEEFLPVLRKSAMCRILSNGICLSPSLSFTKSYFKRRHPRSLKGRPQVRVLSDFKISSQEELLQQVNLRYLDCCQIDELGDNVFPVLESLRQFQLWYLHYGMSYRCIPLFLSSVSPFWNLQTIIVSMRSSEAMIVGPPELWKMHQLRHVHAKNLYLVHPPIGTNCVLKNLHTLMEIVNFIWIPQVVKRIPFMKKIKLRFDIEKLVPFHPNHFGLHNLYLFNDLESLYIDFGYSHMDDRVWFNFIFPESLKKLSLTSFVWDAMTLLGSLPRLQVLKFKGEVRGYEWIPIEGEFRVLQYLEVGFSGLKYWNASSCHFPALRILKFGNVPNLEKIPSDVGDIHTLELISIGACKYSLAVSALEIIKEQEDFGNDSLQVRVELQSKASVKTLQKHMKDIGFTSKNFLLSVDKRRNNWKHTRQIHDDWRMLSIILNCHQIDSDDSDLWNIFTSKDATSAQRQRALEGGRNSSEDDDFAGLKAEQGFRNKETGKRLAGSCSRTQSRSSCSKNNNKHKNNFR